jgi:predicted anti-sigma-YlaC factor YlaD
MEYLEGELPENDMEAVKHHLLECHECSIIFSKMKASWESAKEDRIPYQPFYYTRLKQRMENSAKKSINWAKVRKMMLQPAMYFAILGMGIFIGIQLGKGAGNTTGPTAQVTEQEWLDAYSQEQYIQSVQIDSIEQKLLNTEKTQNDE